ncbi:MAG TPA: hypothetical protein VM759_11030, partial [Longimicrobium sp.]|nr:hypothetical protein [Longimicrobium sp.]
MPTIAESLAQMDVSRQRWSRVGELWTQGPVSERSTVPVSADAYATLLGLALAAGTEDDVRRLRQLRRLYYGPHVRWAEGRRRGVRLDALLSGGEDPELLAWSSRPGELDAATVDALHAAAYLLPALPSALPVDTGAVLAGVETVMSGGSDLALAAEYAVGVPADGTAGWTGDLAAWLLEWIRLRAAAEAAGTPWNDAEAAARLDAVQAERVPLELMLGAMDGRVLGVHLGADVNPLGTPPEVSAPLGAYYGAAAPEEGPHISTRFASFVAAALPVIPHTGEGTAVALGTDAVERGR